MLCLMLCESELPSLRGLLWLQWKDWSLLVRFNLIFNIQRFCACDTTSSPSFLTTLSWCSVIHLHSLNAEVCCKPGAPCLPCCCLGPAIECDGCSVCNLQAHLCCCVASAALPCNDEVPVALTFAGLTVFPKVSRGSSHCLRAIGLYCAYVVYGFTVSLTKYYPSSFPVYSADAACPCVRL